MPNTVVGPLQTFSFNFQNYPESIPLPSNFNVVGNEIRTQGVQGHTKVNDKDTIWCLKFILFLSWWYKFSLMEFQRREQLHPE